VINKWVGVNDFVERTFFVFRDVYVCRYDVFSPKNLVRCYRHGFTIGKNIMTILTPYIRLAVVTARRVGRRWYDQRRR